MVMKPASKRKLNKITISFDDEDEPEAYSTHQTSTNQDRDLDLELDIDETSPKPLPEKPRIQFKKITKKHAARIKEEEEDSKDHSILVKTEDPQLGYNAIKKEEDSGIEVPQLTIDLLQKTQNKSILSLLASKERQRQQTMIKPEPEPEPEHSRAILSDNEPEQDIANDRAWYTQDEQSTNPYLDEDDYFDYETTLNGPDSSTTKISQIIETKRKQNQRFKKQRRNNGESQWFDNRMGMAAGSSTRINEVDDDDINEVSNDIDLVVHRLAPPFLDSATIMSDKLEIIDTIRDKTGDLYKYSRNGSGIVNERRLEKDKKKSAEEATSINDTKIGKILANDNDTTKEIDSSNENADNFIKALGKQSYSSNFSTNLSLKQQREFLPAFKCRSELLKTINENQVIVVIGETGSGKTTQIAQFLYEEGYQNRGLIGVTQPRRVAAMSVAKRVSEEMGVKLGDEVGFSIRFEDFTSDKTKIKFMTDGILLRETLLDPELNKYSCIIMDEAHERSLNTDILLGLFKGILARRRDLKLIVTSATMNADKFSRFFGNAEQFTIPGRTFPVDIMFSTVPSVDYVETAVKQVLRIHLGEKDQGDILCFMTGQEDIETTVFEINKELDQLMKLDENIKPLEILPIYSTLPADLQAKIFKKSKIRKCIVSTNIAETSLTVDGIKYVVDTGLMKLKVYNPKLGMDSLQITPISLAQANQRSGRAGRTGPGKCYRMYTQTASAKEMFVQPIPEIQRTNLSHTILLLKSLNVKDLNKFSFLDRPPIETINTAQYDLWVLGALNNFGDLTPLGIKMSKLPIDPPLSRLLILSALPQFNCLVEMVIIVSMLSIPPVFNRPVNDSESRKKADSLREKFQVIESDHLTLLNIYNQFINNNSRESWCTKNFLQYRSLKRAKDIQAQLSQFMDSIIESNSKAEQDENNWDNIRKCLSASFFQHSSKFKKYGIYQNLRTGLEAHLHPTSSLYGMGDLPKYVIYHELLLTGTNNYMNYVTTVKGEWLVEFGGIFYSEKSRGSSVKENQLNKEQEFLKLLEFEKNQIKEEKESKAKKTESTTVDNERKPGSILFKRKRFGR